LANFYYTYLVIRCCYSFERMTIDSSITSALETLPETPEETVPPIALETITQSQNTVESVTPLQVHLKAESGRLLLILPSQPQPKEAPAVWSDLWLQLKQRLSAGERFWEPNTPVHLIAESWLLDGRQLQEIAEALSECKLQLKLVCTNRRQTAVAAATAGYSVEQESAIAYINQNQLTPTLPGQPFLEPLYLEATLRSGVEVRHPGTVVILGDVNPGSSIIADGDIIIWGRVRGFVHAGARGKRECLIMALQMEPTQLRIADSVARAPENPPAQFFPEVAYITDEGIRIAKALGFQRPELS
jgi:septum site-determining protein MinC